VRPRRTQSDNWSAFCSRRWQLEDKINPTSHSRCAGEPNIVGQLGTEIERPHGCFGDPTEVNFQSSSLLRQ
jgi:hypothetical protein